jgi:hypothetical protein
MSGFIPQKAGPGTTTDFAPTRKTAAVALNKSGDVNHSLSGGIIELNGRIFIGGKVATGRNRSRFCRRL